jgi:hypothetical protein
MRYARVILWLLPLLGSSGCHYLTVGSCHRAQPYMKAQSVPPLKIPTGLDAPENTAALRVPALTEPAPPPRGDKAPCLDEPPSFKVQKPAPAPQA